MAGAIAGSRSGAACGFNKNVSSMSEVINFIEGEIDLAFDKFVPADYDVNLTRTTEVGGQ